MSEKKGRKIFFRVSKKKEHLFGFIPEGGVKEGDSIVIPIKTKSVEEYYYPGVVSVVKGKADFVAASIIEKDAENGGSEER